MHIVMCRACRQKFDTDKLKEGEDWVMPSKNWYYHKQCYDDWKNSTKNANDEDWAPYIYDFLAHDLKVKYDYHLCEGQRKKFIKQNKYTNKGMYLTLKYFYEIKNGDWSKSNGGIGIIPYVYQDATKYWVLQNRKSKDILAALEKQMEERAARQTIKVTKKKDAPKSKAKFSLDDI